MTAQTSFSLDAWSARQLATVELALQRWVAPPEPVPAPAGLGDAMRYAVLDGGKRLRPLLVLAACEAVGGSPAAALRVA
ncbi:MAG: polyprenyl synthetase family protein, partial [Polaromonas sp.]|nr:polyprenyl synthetase family protein [Polaromonas sp.]